MFARSRIEIEILEHLRKPLTRKSTRKRIDIERVPFIGALARLKSNVEFTRQAVNFSILLLENRANSMF